MSRTTRVRWIYGGWIALGSGSSTATSSPHRRPSKARNRRCSRARAASAAVIVGSAGRAPPPAPGRVVAQGRRLAGTARQVGGDAHRWAASGQLREPVQHHNGGTIDHERGAGVKLTTRDGGIAQDGTVVGNGAVGRSLPASARRDQRMRTTGAGAAGRPLRGDQASSRSVCRSVCRSICRSACRWTRRRVSVDSGFQTNPHGLAQHPGWLGWAARSNGALLHLAVNHGYAVTYNHLPSMRSSRPLLV